MRGYMETIIQKILTERGYRELLPAGKGVQGEVYRIRRWDGVYFACKILRDRRLWERQTEFMKAAAHPLFPAYADSFWESGMGFVIMEYVWGQDLDSMLKKRGRFSQEQVLFIGRQIAEGLTYLQEREPPLLFRDLKPANIRVGQDGSVRLLDLGCVCRAEGDGIVAGTPGYAPREQFTAPGQVGMYSDVYAFGRLLSCLLTGRQPNRRKRPGCRKQEKESGRRRYPFKLRKVWRLGPFVREPEALIADCIREERKERLPNMRCVLRRLEQIDKGGWRPAVGREKGTVLYEKSVSRFSE